MLQSLSGGISSRVRDRGNKEDDGEEAAADDDNDDEEDVDNNDEEDDYKGDEDDEEDAKVAANELSEEIERKPLPSALWSSKMGPTQSNLKKDMDKVDKQKVQTLRGGGGKWQVTNNSTGFSDTGQKTQARNPKCEPSRTPRRMKGSADLREWMRFMEDPRTKAAIAEVVREMDEEAEEERRRYDEEHDFESDESDSFLSHDTQYVRQLRASQAEEVKNGSTKMIQTMDDNNNMPKGGIAESSDTGQKTQARKTQGEVVPTESRTKND